MSSTARLFAALQRAEKERLASAASSPLLLAAAIGMGAGGALMIRFADVAVLPWLLLIAAFVAFFLWRSARARLARSFKLLVLPQILAGIAPGLKYNPMGMRESQFRSYGLFERHDRYASQDLVYGSVGQTSIRFAMVHTQKNVGGGKQKNYEDLFKGLLFVAQFNKRVHGTTRVAAGRASLLEEYSTGHVELENPDFDSRFRVKSTDQVEARYIFTPDMQERFVELAGKFPHITAAFFDDRMAMALDLDLGFFDPDVDARFDLVQAGALVEKLKLLIGIVDALDLNTRIWTVK